MLETPRSEPIRAHAGDPHRGHAALRERPAVEFDPTRDAWIVYRYADVRRAFVDPALVPASSLESTLYGARDEAHARVRRMLGGDFSSRSIGQLRGFIRALAEHAVRQISRQGRGDLVEALARDVPARVMVSVMGLPASVAELGAWSQVILREAAGSGDQETFAALQHCRDVLRGTFAGPRPDGALAVFDPISSALSLDARVDLGLLLIVAGFETTTHLLSNASHRLLLDAPLFCTLREHPDRIPAVVEEVLRHASPVQQVHRRAVASTALAGQPIGAGQRLALDIGSANRDPLVFADPNRFDAARQPNPHLAFGPGLHGCLGVWLARLEACEVVEAMLRAWPRMRLAFPLEAVAWQLNPTFYAPARLEVAVT